jgi:uncharacterized membrane protein
VFKRLRFLLNRLRERLWVKPLLVSILSLVVVTGTGYLDRLLYGVPVPAVSLESVTTLLKILSSSMLVIATLAVSSMVSSYNSASTSVNPRAFPLVTADDLSQYALSTFIGAFIFSVIALIAAQNDYYEHAGLFGLLVITLAVFAVVVLTFVRWVDRIARLGLLTNTISKIERVTASAIRQRQLEPTMDGVESTGVEGLAVSCKKTGYVQLVDMEALQAVAESNDLFVSVTALPGRLILPGRDLAIVSEYAGGLARKPARLDEGVRREIAQAFVIGDQRTFDEDPRFGLVALSQIACRAMSPAVNDPGTAIDIIASFVRLLRERCEPQGHAEPGGGETGEPAFPRVAVPRVTVEDMFDDAFGALGREAAGNLEVARRLQTALASLASLGDSETRRAAGKHARLAMARAEEALCLEQDVEAIRQAFPARGFD